MLEKLKGLFGSKSKPKSKGTTAAPKPAKPAKLKRVNINRRFTIVALTGQGSMSRVQKALDNDTGRTVCLKVQHAGKHAAAHARTAADIKPPEGEIAFKVVHPHVVRTYEYGLTPKGEHFISMEFIEGVSLNFIREAKSANLAQKLELLAQAAEGSRPRTSWSIASSRSSSSTSAWPSPTHRNSAGPGTAPARCSTWPPS
jgi:hypothetical protein